MKDHLLLSKRQEYKPKLPHIFEQLDKVKAEFGVKPEPYQDQDKLGTIFQSTYLQPLIHFSTTKESVIHHPKKVGVVFSGGQAPGGHNVVCGLFDSLKKLNPNTILYGFLGGPKAMVDYCYRELDRNYLYTFQNMGGFDMLGSGRDKIETAEQLSACEATAKALDLDALVIIGGDDSNTNAAILAEHFRKKGCKTCVLGVPKTIDGDLRHEHIEMSFGFDTATKVYSNIISNIMRDALSSKKYIHFIKLMGRSASHITLECAMQTQPNITFITEEIQEKGFSLKNIVDQIVDWVVMRSQNKIYHGVVLIPEGLIEALFDMQLLIQEIKQFSSSVEDKELSLEERKNALFKSLSENAKQCYQMLPEKIQDQFLLEKDPHGNIPLSKIETESLIVELVQKKLETLKKKGEYSGKFNPQTHFLGYEGRSAMPSNFDAQYGYCLGYVATLLINASLTGYVVTVKNLHQPVELWVPGAIPLVSMMHIEERNGSSKPVIKKYVVHLKKELFQQFNRQRKEWEMQDCYRYVGPMQFFGDPALTEEKCLSITIPS